MVSFLVEAYCPKHGLERFRVDVIKKYNIYSNAIILAFRRKPTKQLSKIVIGRNVTEKEAQDALMKYFKESGLIEMIISIKLIR